MNIRLFENLSVVRKVLCMYINKQLSNKFGKPFYTNNLGVVSNLMEYAKLLHKFKL